eukprot:3763040-Pyramimonas_sp.AAC.1
MIGAIEGHVAQTIDRCLDSDPSSLLAHVLVKLRCLEFPWSVLDRAVKRVCRKHPYLLCLKQAFCSARSKLG